MISRKIFHWIKMISKLLINGNTRESQYVTSIIFIIYYKSATEHQMDLGILNEITNFSIKEISLAKPK